MEDFSIALKQALNINATEFEVINADDEKTDAPCRFFDLPAEIRNLIYDWVLWRPWYHYPAEVICSNNDGENFDIIPKGIVCRVEQSLFLVNKQFSTELAVHHFCHTEYKMRVLWCNPSSIFEKPTNKNYGLLNKITNCFVHISQQTYFRVGHGWEWERIEGFEKDARFLDSILAKMTSLKKVEIDFTINRELQVEEEEITSRCAAYRNLTCQKSITIGPRTSSL